MAILRALFFVAFVARVAAQSDESASEAYARLLKEQDSASPEELAAAANDGTIERIMELDDSLPINMKTTGSGILTRVRSSQDASYVRLKREELKVSDVKKRLSDMESTLDNTISEDVLSKLIKDSVEKALAGSKALIDLAKDMQDYSDDFSDRIDETNTNLDNELNGMKKSLDDLLVTVNDTQTANNKKLSDAIEAVDDDIEDLEKDLLETVDDKLKPTADLITKLQKTWVGDSKVPVFRMAKFHTYNWGSPWMDNNNPKFFGGVHPSTWTDGNARVIDMDWTPSTIRKIFHMRNIADKSGLNACSEAYVQRTSTNGYLCIVMFRIKNTKNTQLTFFTNWRYSADMGWSERASVAVNKKDVWHGDCNAQNYCSRSLNIAIPPGKTSTVMFSAPSTGRHCTYSKCYRSTYNAFDNLRLPDGLEFVDDLDTATSLV